MIKPFLFLCPLLIFLPGKKDINRPPQTDAKWSGTVSFQVTTKYRDGGTNIWKMDAVIHNDTGTATHSSQFQRPNNSGSCFNQAKTELEVGFDSEHNEYSIFVAVPGCYGKQLDYGVEKDYGTTDETGIQIDRQPLGSNHNVLAGMLVDSVFEEDGSGSITIYRWNLSRGDVTDELIVTPVSSTFYDSWMPEAGPDEQTPGNKLQIDLKVQGKNGTAPSLKVIRFELKLNQTSTEKGTTLNMPLSDAQSLPDLRFEDTDEDRSSADGQFFTVESPDGRTGTAIIDSYDGGGWTVLTVEAILEGGMRVKGKLLNSSGTTDIQVPKRQPGTKIASAWLKANGNPGELDDNDRSPNNTNPGDGLSAYEEYRGVWSSGHFERLTATQKDLGVTATDADAAIFKTGYQWFESATGIHLIRFRDEEIDQDRNLNKNNTSAHIYDQFVLRIQQGATSKLASGENRPTNLNSMIPRQSELVVINTGYIDQVYTQQAQAARADHVVMPYTHEELLASTVAHELCHGVDVSHHGEHSNAVQGRIFYEGGNARVHIFDSHQHEIPVQSWSVEAGTNRHYYEIFGNVGDNGCETSGDLSCFMTYTSIYNWSFKTGADGSLNYYMVPLLPIGKKLCTKAAGTGINATQYYFGNAAKGNCAGQIRFK